MENYKPYGNEWKTEMKKQNASLAEALKDLILSSDISWYEKNQGHDFREAVDRAREILESLPTAEGKEVGQ